jgi:hypothetical protein
MFLVLFVFFYFMQYQLCLFPEINVINTFNDLNVIL